MKIKLFTKKDKRSELDKRIDEVSEKMSIVIAQLKENGYLELDHEINKIREAMNKLDPICADYQNMIKTLDVLYKIEGMNNILIERYSKLADQYRKLNEIKNAEKSRNIISKDTLIKCGFILLGTALTIYAEDTRVITSKAFSRLPNMKL